MDTIRLVSWNVNGFRALSGKPDWDWFASTDADVVALKKAITDAGYEVVE